MTAPSITVEYVDPASLLVDLNVRSEAQLDKDFLASIRDLGVLVPIVAVRTTDGSLRVRFGKRRTLASVEVGQPLVPAVIVGEEDADQVARIVSQWHENEYRSGLGTKDKLAAVEQLSLLGLSAAQIVKQTKARKQDVEQALAASRSDLAKGAAERYEFLTLDAASAVAEFESNTSTVKALVAAAKQSDGDFRHALQRARDDRDEAAQQTALIEQHTAAGTQVIDRPDYADKTTRRLTSLLDSTGKRLSEQTHAACPGHAVYIEHNWQGIEAIPVCTDWPTHGHHDPDAASARLVGPMDDKAKAERKLVITNNKEWKSASVVRRDWITTFVSRKTAPRGAAVYVAAELARGSHELRRAMERSPELAATLLGADASHSRQSVTALTDTATDARAQVIALGVVLGAVEASTSTDTWRNPTEAVKRYFAFLSANGYVLAEVEQIAAGTYKKAKRRTARAEASADAEQAAA
ncbi:MAG TPA: ParB N-terminal domain-containing protein [Jatrophihabitantaceae bacterium]|jgi:ParB family chromosome partitioning protein